MMTLTLSADHRVVDGVYVAKFRGKAKKSAEVSPQISFNLALKYVFLLFLL
jgi:pyruvate/2-oxoglutarate dehydrogenase complex dihydrolipoamide acyltransferase (E2) component